MWFIASVYLGITAAISLGVAHRWTAGYGISVAVALTLLGALALFLHRRELRLDAERNASRGLQRAAFGQSSRSQVGGSPNASSGDTVHPSPAHWSFYSPSFVGGHHDTPSCSSRATSSGGIFSSSDGGNDCGGGDGGGGGGD